MKRTMDPFILLAKQLDMQTCTALSARRSVLSFALLLLGLRGKGCVLPLEHL